MNVRWVVIPVVFAAACASNDDSASMTTTHTSASNEPTPSSGAAPTPAAATTPAATTTTPSTSMPDAGAPPVVSDAGASNDAGPSGDPAPDDGPCVKTTRIPLLAGSSDPVVVAINQSGQIAGQVTAGGTSHAFFRNGTTLTDLNPEGGNAFVKGLNDRGDVIFQKDPGRSFLWRAGQVTPIGGESTDVEDINAAGKIVGSMSDPANTDGLVRHAFYWENGVINDLGTFLGSAGAQRINDQGMIVGYTTSVAPSGPPEKQDVFVWKNGSSTFTGKSPVGEDPNVIALNENGQLLLRMQFFDGPSHAYVWQSGTFTKVSTFDGSWLDSPYAMNEGSAVVGVSEVGPGGEAATRELRAFFARAGAVSAVIAPDGKVVRPTGVNEGNLVSGWTSTFTDNVEEARPVAWKDGSSLFLADEFARATSVNDAGQIAGATHTEARIWDVSTCFKSGPGSGH